LASLDPTGRFTDRVKDYVRARPGYPAALLEWLGGLHRVGSPWLVVDAGAGTGISSRLFLEVGHAVVAVEPNAAMRAASVEALGENPRFRAVEGTAEATSLGDASADLVVAAQAFHWFDPEAVRLEWRRILRPYGLALVVFNARRTAGTAFLAGYEELLRRYSTDYAAVAERYPEPDRMRAFFGPGFRAAQSFENRQVLDLDALRARLLSSSYTPAPGRPGHEAMLHALVRLFDRTADGGRVTLEYETRAYLGRP